MKRTLALLLALTFAVCVAPAYASFHEFKIDQVFSNADGTVQYVVMSEPVTGDDEEGFWQGHALTTVSTAGGTQQFPFPTDLPSQSTKGRSVLIATSGFAALGILAPDFTIPDHFIPTLGGTLNYAGVNQISLPVLPNDGATAIDRNGTHVPATPKNFAGATATLTAAPPPVASAPDLDQHGLTGSWYEPATSGQGIEVEFFPDLVAPGTAFVQGAWFTFDGAPSGGADRQRWYTFSGNAQRGNANVPVTIFQNVGGNFDAPPMTSAMPVGTGTLAFSQCNAGTFDYTFADGSGRMGSIPLTRITPNVTCAVGTAPATNGDFGLSGNWFDPTTSGQGFVFEVNPNVPVFFFAWYTYAPTGQSAGAAGQRWFTGQASYAVGSRVMMLTLFETTGGLFDQPTSPAPSTVPVGTSTVTFASCTSAQLQFNFTGGSSAGKSGTIALVRVGPVPPGCVSSSAGMAMPPGMGYPGGYGPP